MFFMIYLVVITAISVNIFRSILRNEILLRTFTFISITKQYTRLFLKKLFILISSIFGIYIAIFLYFHFLSKDITNIISLYI